MRYPLRPIERGLGWQVSLWWDCAGDQYRVSLFASQTLAADDARMFGIALSRKSRQADALNAAKESECQR